MLRWRSPRTSRTSPSSTATGSGSARASSSGPRGSSGSARTRARRRMRAAPERSTASGRRLLPGLIDVHVHLQFDGDADFEKEARDLTTPGFAALKAMINAQRNLDAGVTTVRDLGGMGGASIDVARAVAAGLVPGPRDPGGRARAHGHRRPRPQHRVLPRGGRARRRPRRGPRGDPRGRDRDQADRDGRRPHPGHPGDVQRVHGRRARGRRSRGARAEPVGRGARDRRERDPRGGPRRGGFDRALQPAHGGDGARDGGARDVPLADDLRDPRDPRSRGPRRGLRGGEGPPDRGGLEEVAAHARSAPASAPVCGTDAGTPFNAHGNAPQEVVYMVEWGMAPLDALRAATANGAKLLRLEDVGTIEVGQASGPGARRGRSRRGSAGVARPEARVARTASPSSGRPGRVGARRRPPRGRRGRRGLRVSSVRCKVSRRLARPRRSVRAPVAVARTRTALASSGSASRSASPSRTSPSTSFVIVGGSTCSIRASSPMRFGPAKTRTDRTERRGAEMPSASSSTRRRRKRWMAAECSRSATRPTSPTSRVGEVRLDVVIGISLGYLNIGAESIEGGTDGKHLGRSLRRDRGGGRRWGRDDPGRAIPPRPPPVTRAASRR